MDISKGLWSLAHSCEQVAIDMEFNLGEIVYQLVPRKWAADKMVVAINFTNELSIDIAIDEIGFVNSEVELDNLVRLRTQDSVYSLSDYYTDFLVSRVKNL